MAEMSRADMRQRLRAIAALKPLEGTALSAKPEEARIVLLEEGLVAALNEQREAIRFLAVVAEEKL